MDMKKGMRNLPLRTRARKFCRVLPSKGRAPHTNTYNTTPKLYTEKRQQETNYEYIIFKLGFNKQVSQLLINPERYTLLKKLDAILGAIF